MLLRMHVGTHGGLNPGKARYARYTEPYDKAQKRKQNERFYPRILAQAAEHLPR